MALPQHLPQHRGRTGSYGQPWIHLAPKPPPVGDPERWWTEKPPVLSARCSYWLTEICRGWLPNRRWRMFGYYEGACAFGVWIWEYQHLIAPLVESTALRLTTTIGPK